MADARKLAEWRAEQRASRQRSRAWNGGLGGRSGLPTPLQMRQRGSSLGFTLRTPLTGSGSTPTVVVAASDASQRSKDVADFICDGTDDHLDFHAARDALPDPGGRVVATEGTFRLGSRILVNRHMELSGVGPSTVFRPASRATFPSAEIIRVEYVDGRPSTLRDFTVDGLFEGGATETYRGVFVATPGGHDAYNVHAVNSCGHGLSCLSVGPHLFDGCTVLGGGTGGAGIAVQSGSGGPVRVVGCHVKRSGVNGIQSSGEALVVGCAVIGAAVGYHSGAGGNVVEACEFRDCTTRGMRAHAADIFVGNRIAGGGEGIRVQSAADALIAGNWIEGVSGDGIQITTASHRADVTGNRLRNIGEHGIHMRAGTSTTINGNRIWRASTSSDASFDGIHIIAHGGAQVFTDDITVINNKVRHGGSGNRNRYGINNAGEDCWITNNDLLDSGQTAAFNDTGTGTVTTAGNRT